MRVGRTESPRTRPGSGRYQAYQDDDWGQDQEYGGSARSRPPRSTDASYQKVPHRIDILLTYPVSHMESVPHLEGGKSAQEG